ncbi:MAG: hypothetical protein E7627_02160 [Ruminococcaceae bacterium]|nr:hypothetical protein [Oscillospiraceae bacterium]
MNGLISFENFALQPVSREILELNEVSSQYGLVLTEDEARELSDMRNTALNENERIEMGTGTVCEIIKRFCTSHYVNPENYAYVLNEVTYLFYYIKTETDDGISDQALIDELFNRFELWCHGSIDTLAGREVERIIRKINSGEHYKEWYTDRDELDYDESRGAREAPSNVALDAYGNEFFNNSDSPADHDKYEADSEEIAAREDENDHFDIDAFDEFLDRLAEAEKSIKAKKDNLDDEEDGKDE